MSIRIECSACGRAYQVAEQLSGKKVRCKHCQAVIPVPGSSYADPSRTHISRPGAHMTEPPPAFDSEDRPFEGMGDEDPEQTEIAAPPPASRGGLQTLEMIVPIVIALCCLGWLIVRALQNEDAAHSWIGPFRVAIYLFIYAAIAFPIALRGAKMVGKKLYLPMPGSPNLKSFGIFCAPFALGSVLALTADTPIMLAVGALFGLIISLGSFVFIFNLQARHISRGLTIAGIYLALGTGIGFGALYGVDVLLQAILTVSHSSADYLESPLGPAFAWNPPPADVEHHKPKSAPTASTQNDIADNDSATTNPSTPPSTQEANSANPPIATTLPATTLPFATTQQTHATTLPTTQLVSATSPAHSDSPPTALSLSPLLAAAPVKIVDDQALDVFFPGASGTPACLVLRTRTDFGDELELWNGPNWAKSQSFTAQPKTMQDNGGIVLSPKANFMARTISMIHSSVKIRPLTGDTNLQDRQTRIVDLEAIEPGTPYLLGFTSTGLVEVVWHTVSDAVALVDPQASNSSGVRSRLIQLPGLENHPTNVLITPDTHFAVSLQHVMNTTTTGAPPGNYFVVDSMFGTEGPQHFTMTNMPADRNVQLAGMSGSSDGKRVAVMYLENGNGLIEIYHLPDAARISSHIFSGEAAQWINNYHGSNINWIAGDSALLINGRYVMDSQSFGLVGDLGVADVKSAYAIDRRTLALLVSSTPGHCSLMIATLNAEKFPALSSTGPTTNSARTKSNP